jgi:peptidoglycan/xylan/chitin deacetylase (PgdA/CDA1 family)
LNQNLLPTAIPILLYHSISNDPSRHVRPFTVTVEAFRQQLDLIADSGRTSVSVSTLVHGLSKRAHMPERPIVITFDDGFADFADIALDALIERGLSATLYVTTGFLSGRPHLAVVRPFDDRMLSWAQLREVASRGVEIGAHTHSHPQLDTLSRQDAWREITKCKSLLETELGAPVISFAYPHGYSSHGVRQLVRVAGYQSACGVTNALSSMTDDPFALARLTVQADTGLEQFANWIHGRGARRASLDESLATRTWRLCRRVKASVRRRRERRRRAPHPWTD